MVDKLETVGPKELAEKKVTLEASFSCPACASGAEHYHELFNQGACRNCGNPLKEFSATLTEKGEKEMKSSVLLLYSKDDMAAMAADVTAELEKNGIRVTDVHDIIDGSQTSVVSANLAFVMEMTAGVLVIPSEHLEDDHAIATCFGNAIVQSVERSKKLVPIYTAENIKGKVPYALMDTIGVNWDGKVDDMRALGKESAVAFIQKFTRENASK